MDEVFGTYTFLLLVRAFRSVLLAAKAVVFNLISLAAVYGVLTWVWQDGHGSRALWGIPATGAITMWVPLMVFAFLFGLSMDYEVFTLSRIRQAYDASGDVRSSVVLGLDRTGRLVTRAAAILMLGFLYMSTGPQTDLKVLATGLGAGILIDAVIVRVPAAGHDHVPAAQLAQQRLNVAGVFDVVQDHQPPVMGLQPSGRPPGRIPSGARHRHHGAQPPGQPGLHLPGVGRGDPPHQTVVLAVGVGVLQSQLRLADPAQPVHRLRHHRPAPRLQRPLEHAQRLIAALEHPHRAARNPATGPPSPRRPDAAR